MCRSLLNRDPLIYFILLFIASYLLLICTSTQESALCGSSWVLWHRRWASNLLEWLLCGRGSPEMQDF
jgi:hypothetical protein